MPNPAVRKIYYTGIIDFKGIASQCEETIAKLQSRTYAASDLEKIKNYQYQNNVVYSLRINGSKRLFFTIVPIQGNPCLLLLEFREDHRYERSALNRPSYLRKILASLSDELEFDIVNEEDRAKIEELSRFSKKYARAYYTNQAYELSDIQNQASLQSLPLVVGGVAGSGKTSVAWVKIEAYAREFIRQHEAGLELPSLLFVSQSRNLIAHMIETWEKSEWASLIPEGKVLFKTNEALFFELADSLQHGVLVDFSYFSQWYKRYCKTQHSAVKALSRGGQPPAASGAEFHPPDVGTVYQGIRMCAAFDKDSYLKLGEKEALDVSIRAFVWKAHEAYAAELKVKQPRELWEPLYRKTQKARGKPVIDADLDVAYENYKHYGALHDLALMDLPEGVANVFYEILSDETQDLSYLQIKALWKLAINRATLFLMDSHQSTVDSLSKRDYLVQLVSKFKGSPEESYLELPGTYRCAQSIAEFSSLFIAIKNYLSHGIADKREALRIESSHPFAGQVMACAEEVILERLQTVRSNPRIRIAIVTHESFIDDTRRLFDWPFIFSTEQIKGLEFTEVIAYRLFDLPEFQTACKSISVDDLAKEIKHRAPAGSSDYSKKIIFNQIITALTRATLHLFLVGNLKDLPLVLRNNPFVRRLEQINLPPPLQEEYLPSKEEAIKLVRLNLMVQAKSFCVMHLKMNEAEAKAFIVKETERFEALVAPKLKIIPIESAEKPNPPAPDKPKESEQQRPLPKEAQTSCNEPMCPKCKIKPRYINEGIYQPFCSRACHNVFSSSNTQCVCCDEPRCLNQGVLGIYCGIACASANRIPAGMPFYDEMAPVLDQIPRVWPTKPFFPASASIPSATIVDFRAMTVEDLGIWLSTQGEFVEKQRQLFAEKSINGNIFYELTDSDLIILGVQSSFARKRMLYARDEVIREAERSSSAIPNIKM